MNFSSVLIKIRFLLIFIALFTTIVRTYAQSSNSAQSGRIKQLHFLEDSLKHLGKKIINEESEPERINANYNFIKTLVTALKTPNSFQYNFDSVKSVSILTSPDHKFRIFTWPLVYDDGSFRFFGAIQMNSENLQLFPLEDFTLGLKSPEDSISTNHKWYGAQYYKIVPVYYPQPYYILLGWKGNNDITTKKVIEVLSFKEGKPEFGKALFEGNRKTRKRVVFEYTRQASMLLRFEADKSLIVFDHLSPPDEKSKNKPETYGPDLSYDGYKLRNGKWLYVDKLDMRNIPDNHDIEYNAPKKLDSVDKAPPAKIIK